MTSQSWHWHCDACGDRGNGTYDAVNREVWDHAWYENPGHAVRYWPRGRREEGVALTITIADGPGDE